MKPQPALLKKWRLMLVVGAVVPAFLNALFFAPGEAVWLAVTCVWVLLFLFFYLFYLPARLRRLRYAVCADKVAIYSGVFFIRIRAIPLSSIQFTTEYASPLDLVWGLSAVIVAVPGARFVLRGLRRQDAQALSELLSGADADAREE